MGLGQPSDPASKFVEDIDEKAVAKHVRFHFEDEIIEASAGTSKINAPTCAMSIDGIKAEEERLKIEHSFLEQDQKTLADFTTKVNAKVATLMELRQASKTVDQDLLYSLAVETLSEQKELQHLQESVEARSQILQLALTSLKQVVEASVVL